MYFSTLQYTLIQKPTCSACLFPNYVFYLPLSPPPVFCFFLCFFSCSPFAFLLSLIFSLAILYHLLISFYRFSAHFISLFSVFLALVFLFLVFFSVLFRFGLLFLCKFFCFPPSPPHPFSIPLFFCFLCFSPVFSFLVCIIFVFFSSFFFSSVFPSSPLSPYPTRCAHT